MRSSADRQHLQQLQVLRVVIFLVQGFAVFLGYHYLSSSQQQSLMVLLLCEALVIGSTQWRISRHSNQDAMLGRHELLLHLFIDSLLLTVLLYLAGGATNPFVSYYLVPIAVSAATLSIDSTALLTAFCLLAYTLLMYYFQPLQILSPHEDMILYSNDHHSMQMMTHETPNMHVVGMWLNFGFSALLITYFVTRMAESLRYREAELSSLREKQLRDGQVLGIATLAAGTAHELGTPLATLAILADDLKLSATQYPELAPDIVLMTHQITACKQILQNLSRAAEQQDAGILQNISVKEYLKAVLMHWRVLHPGIAIEENLSSISPNTEMARIDVDATLEQALMNLLNNAAEASPQGITLQMSTVVNNKGQRCCCIEIRDQGDGIAIDPKKLGKPFVSSHGQGRGLGVFLSRAAIERLGGTLSLKAHPQGGTLVQVELPLL